MDAERKYDALKLECRGLLKALKKFRFWSFGRFFLFGLTLKRSYGFSINLLIKDLPNAMITRWLTYSRLFNFNVKHVPVNKNSAADGLSRQGNLGDEWDDGPDNYFESKRYSTSANPLSLHDPIARVLYICEEEYTSDDIILGQY
jgi:hypothetical protein